MSGVRLEVDDAVARIVLSRPEAANSFDLDTAEAFGEAVAAAEACDARAVLLMGEGDRFCAGGDVAAIASLATAGDRPAYLHELATLLDAHLRRLADMAKPVVAGVHGSVAGAGLSLVLSADVCVAAESTRFLMAYPGVGLTPDCGVSWLLPRAVGQQRALDLALTGRVLSAREARDWGMVGEVVDDDSLPDRAAELAARLAAGPTHAFAQAKRLIRTSWATRRSEHGADEADTIAGVATHPQSAALVDAFAARG